MKFVPKRLVETADVSRGASTLLAFFKNTFLAAVFFGGLYLILGLVAALLASFIPDSWERKLTGHVPGEFEQDERLDRPQALLDRLLAADDLRNLDYELYLVDFPGPNAFALPGGGIAVTGDLLDTVESDIGLAFVLAHEVGHHQHRHILKGLGRRLIYGLFASAIFGLDGPVDGAFEVAQLHHSRQQEVEADLEALERVHRAFGTVEGAFEFFESMQEQEPEGEWFRYVSTHPLTRERILLLQGEAAALSEARDGEASDRR